MYRSNFNLIFGGVLDVTVLNIVSFLYNYLHIEFEKKVHGRKSSREIIVKRWYFFKVGGSVQSEFGSYICLIHCLVVLTYCVSDDHKIKRPKQETRRRE